MRSGLCGLQKSGNKHEVLPWNVPEEPTLPTSGALRSSTCHVSLPGAILGHRGNRKQMRPPAHGCGGQTPRQPPAAPWSSNRLFCERGQKDGHRVACPGFQLRAAGTWASVCLWLWGHASADQRPGSLSWALGVPMGCLRHYVVWAQRGTEQSGGPGAATAHLSMPAGCHPQLHTTWRHALAAFHRHESANRRRLSLHEASASGRHGAGRGAAISRSERQARRR